MHLDNFAKTISENYRMLHKVTHNLPMRIIGSGVARYDCRLRTKDILSTACPVRSVIFRSSFQSLKLNVLRFFSMRKTKERKRSGKHDPRALSARWVRASEGVFGNFTSSETKCHFKWDRLYNKNTEEPRNGAFGRRGS